MLPMQNYATCQTLKYTMAPMVSQSDAPFRSLCLKYGTTAVYTEMLYSEKIVKDEEYLDAYFPDIDQSFDSDFSSASVIVQVCGNDPSTLATAVSIIAHKRPWIHAVDFNLGCPQDRARDGLFGSYLLDNKYWPLVFSCVKACSHALSGFNVPFFCKIRLIEGSNPVELTTEFCR
jgi:tRNA-dihydrouridine synthase 1